VRQSKKAVLSLVVGIGLTQVGSVLLLLTLPLLLQGTVPELPLWACVGLVGGILAVVGGVLVYLELKKLESFHPLSNPAAEAFKENLTWTTSPK
jgi:putative exporter of polyketide antibiotics